MIDNTISDIWNNTLKILKEEISPVSFETWIMTLKPSGIKDGKFIVKTYDDFTKGMIESRHLRLIQNALKEASSQELEVLIVTEKNDEQNKQQEPAKESAKSVVIQASNTSDSASPLNPKYIFETFVVGSGNRMAHAAAVAVAEAPAIAYNPLFLYGGVGLGKTHLMHSVAHHILEQNPSAKVLYVSSETFTNELINAIKHATNEKFRKKYREIDVLLIDDIQFISEKESTQEEFFHTFNTLHDANKQIIISSDRPPKEIKTLEERLSSRFKQGLIADIKPPDFETRIAIVTKKAERDGMVIPKDILTYIAKTVDTNIRELEGALTRVVAYSKLTNTELSLPLTINALNEIYNSQSSREVTSELIVEIVANHFQIKPDDIRNKKRTQVFTHPRQIAMYLCRKLLNDSLTKIGDSFGGRDHTTIMHGCEKIADKLEQDANLKNTMEELEKKITGGSFPHTS